MSGFHTATICADCDPPVVAISTGSGSRCPRCGQNEGWPSLVTDACDTRLDGALARQIIVDVAVRSDGDARLLAELAGRLLARAGNEIPSERELAELRDLADLVRDADISALPPELLEVRQRWFAESYAREVAEAEAVLVAKTEAAKGETPAKCRRCAAGEPSIWDGVLFHYAHSDGLKLTACDDPWRARCRRCSADPVAPRVEFCAFHEIEEVAR